MSAANLIAKQKQAIVDSGWAQKVKLIQPRNFTFWVTMFLLFGGFFLTFVEIQPAVAAYTNSLAQGTIYFGILGAILLWIILRLDRFSKVPGNMKFLIILLGGVVATFAMAKFYNDAFLDILTKTQGSNFVYDWGAGLTAPISEEVAKIVPLILMLGLAPKIVRSAHKGFIIGAISGLAFQIFEDVVYVYKGVGATFGDPLAGTLVLGMRTVLGVTGHWMWSAVVGAGLIYLIGRSVEPARRYLGISLIVSVLLLHGLWDAVGALAGGTVFSFVLNAVFGVMTLVLFVIVYRYTAKREQDWMRDILAPEVANGVVKKEELEAVAGRRKSRRKYVKAKKGFMAERRTKHVLEAIHDLADQLGVDKGENTEKVEHARAEIARIRKKIPTTA